MDRLERIARNELEALKREWNYPQVNLKVDRTKRWKWLVGRAAPSDLSITLGGACHDYDELAIREVVRHEFAHLLEWRSHRKASHSPIWRFYAKVLGCRPRANSSEIERVEAMQAATYDRKGQ